MSRALPWVVKSPRDVTPNLIDVALRTLVRNRAGGCCEACGERLPIQWECHHRKLRSQGGKDAADNLLALDFTCHRRLHNRRVWAEAHGFIVRSYEDPAAMPVALRGEDWRYLTVDGGYLPAGDAS